MWKERISISFAAAAFVIFIASACSRSPAPVTAPQPPPAPARPAAMGPAGVPPMAARGTPPPVGAHGGPGMTGPRGISIGGAASVNGPLTPGSNTAPTKHSSAAHVAELGDEPGFTAPGKGESLPFASAAAVATAGKISELDTQSVLLQREVAIEKLKAELKSLKEGPKPQATGSAQVSAAASAQAPAAPRKERTPLPVVSAMYGVKDALAAVLSYEGGGEMQVSRGSRIPGGVVNEVDHDGVTVTVDGGKHRLMFAAAPLAERAAESPFGGLPGGSMPQFGGRGPMVGPGAMAPAGNLAAPMPPTPPAGP